MLQQQQSLAQRKQDDLIITKTAPQYQSTGTDAVLAKRVIIVQAHIRGHLARKRLEPVKVQIRAATTIQAYWYSKRRHFKIMQFNCTVHLAI